MAAGQEKVVFGLVQPASLQAFGGALRKVREGLGMTLDVLAAKTGISKPYLSNIETARAPGPPSEEKLEKIARALGLEATGLLAGADWLRTPESVRRVFQEMKEGVASSGEAPRRGDGTIDLDRLVPGRAKSEV